MGDKSPRQLAKLEKQGKRATSAVSSRPGKRAVASPDTTGINERLIRFRFNRVDVGGPWCLSYISPEDHLLLIEFMRQMEAKTVGEVFLGDGIGKFEDVASDSPNGEAKRRAQEQYPTDAERLVRLRLTGPKRLWGLMFDHEFSIAWWDPNHTVWPARRRNT